MIMGGAFFVARFPENKTIHDVHDTRLMPQHALVLVA